MVGCGSIGQGLLPLLFRAFSIRPDQVSIVSADDGGRHAAESFGVGYCVNPITRSNYRDVLAHYLRAGDLLINLSVDVSSVALIAWCKFSEVLYLDTCVEPWKGGYHGAEATNAWLRRQALNEREPDSPTAVIAHGMNPGLISHFLKEALLALAQRKGVCPDADWASLAASLGVTAVHIAERDTQDDGQTLERGEFANTWSAEGMYSEAWLQKGEIFWGTCEAAFPEEAAPSIQRHVLTLPERGADFSVKSWTPSQGEQRGMLVTHHEVMSIGELLGSDEYRPTVCYVYNPCPKARDSLSALRAGFLAERFRVLKCDALQGFDEVGVLLIHETGSLWYGSTLDCREARRLAPYNSATSMQVVAGIIGALTWMLDHPRAGVVEAESLDSSQILAVALPYLGRVRVVETDWRAAGGPEPDFGCEPERVWREPVYEEAF